MSEKNLGTSCRRQLLGYPRWLPRWLDVLRRQLPGVFIASTRIADGDEPDTSMLERVVVGKLIVQAEVQWEQFPKVLASRSPVVVACNGVDKAGGFIEDQLGGFDANVTQQDEKRRLLSFVQFSDGVETESEPTHAVSQMLKSSTMLDR